MFVRWYYKTKFAWDVTTNDQRHWIYVENDEEMQQIKLNKRCIDSEYHGSQIGRVCFHSIWNDSALGLMLHRIFFLFLSLKHFQAKWRETELFNCSKNGYLLW